MKIIWCGPMDGFDQQVLKVNPKNMLVVSFGAKDTLIQIKEKLRNKSNGALNDLIDRFIASKNVSHGYGGHFCLAWE